jgi:hypothetical protein
MFVCCVSCVLSGRDLCEKLITRPEESYRLWRVDVCDHETLWTRRPYPRWTAEPEKNNKKSLLMRIKGKGRPITYLCGCRGEADILLQSIRHPTLESSGWLSPRSGCLISGKVPVYGAGWASGPIWTTRDSIPGLYSPLRDAIPSELSRPPFFIIPWSCSAINDLNVILTLSVTLCLLFTVAINWGILQLIIIIITIIVTYFVIR